MKKIYFFIASLFIAIGAMAQTVVTTINTDRAYTLECKSSNAHSTARFIGITDNGVINGQSSTAAYITFEAGEEDGTYYIKVGEKYLNHDGTTISASTEKSTAWIFNNPYTGLVTFQLPNTTRYLNNNGTDTTDGTVTYLKANNHSSGPSTSNACSTWEMCEYDLDNSVEVTYQYMFNGSMVKEATVTQAIGSDYAAPAIDYVTFAYPDGAVTAETTTVEVTCTQSLPFTVSTSYADATWYYMSIRSSNEKWVARSESAPYTNSKTKTTDDNGLWAFMGNAFDGIQVINKGAGEGYTLGYAGTATGSDIYMMEGTTSWIIEEGNGGFLLRQAADYVYAHDYDSKLQIWNHASAPTDAGSAFQVYDPANNSTSVAALQDAIDAANAKSAYIGTEIGLYTYTGEGSYADAIAEYQTYIDGITSTTTPTPDEVDTKTAELNAIVASLTLNAPATGKYYRLKNVVNNRYMSANESSVTVIDDGGEVASTIFYLGENNTLLSYTQGRYLDCSAKNLAEVGTSHSGLFAAAYGTPTANVITYKNNGYWTFGARDNGVSIDRGSSTPNQNGYSWVIEEVTELPVSITSAGYATFFAPVEVSFSGIEAYYTIGEVDEATGEYIQMIDLTGSIPANQGAILKGDEGTYNLTINYGGTATLEGNKLTGSIAKAVVTKEDGNAYYILANGDYGIGLYSPVNGEETGNFYNAGHKAYMIIEGASQAVGYSFNFDWAGTTGIEGVEAEGTQNGKIYDITGREIKAITAPGIYIVNGRKVVIK